MDPDKICDTEQKRQYKHELLGTVQLNERGQVVIPAGARKRIGVQNGDTLMVFSTPDNGGLILAKPGALENAIHKIANGEPLTEE